MSKPRVSADSKNTYSYYFLIDHGGTKMDGHYEFELSGGRKLGRELFNDYIYLGTTEGS
jgi:hypothetical protein